MTPLGAGLSSFYAHEVENTPPPDAAQHMYHAEKRKVSLDRNDGIARARLSFPEGNAAAKEVKNE
jgi:hypothetical protein